MMEWKRLFLEHQTLWVDRCLLRDLWLWLCPPAMYSSIWKESSRSSCKLFMCGCLLSIMKEKKQTKDVSSCFCSRSGSLQPSVSQSQCNFVFLSAMFLIILQYIWCPVLYMVWIHVWGGVFESQYRKMLYFCYEIYYAYLYPSGNYVFFLLFLNVYI